MAMGGKAKPVPPEGVPPVVPEVTPVTPEVTRGFKQFIPAIDVAKSIVQQYPVEDIRVFGSLQTFKRAPLSERQARSLLGITKAKPDLDIVVRIPEIESFIKERENQIDFQEFDIHQYIKDFPEGYNNLESIKGDVIYQAGENYYKLTSAGLQWITNPELIKSLREATPIKEVIASFESQAFMKAKPVTPTTPEVTQLKELGWSDARIAELDAGERASIIRNKITPEAAKEVAPAPEVTKELIPQSEMPTGMRAHVKYELTQMKETQGKAEASAEGWYGLFDRETGAVWAVNPRLDIKIKAFENVKELPDNWWEVIAKHPNRPTWQRQIIEKAPAEVITTQKAWYEWSNLKDDPGLKAKTVSAFVERPALPTPEAGIAPAIKGHEQMSSAELQAESARLDNIIKQYQKIKNPTMKQMAAYDSAVMNKPSVDARLGRGKPERRGLGGGNVPDIGSETNPVTSPYGLPTYRKNGFWWTQGYSMTGSGERTWARLTDPKMQAEYDANYTEAKPTTVPAEIVGQKPTTIAPEVTAPPPAQVPPKPPELEVSPEPIKTPRGINFAPLQDTQTTIDIATKPDASRWLANLPLFKQIMSRVNPSAIANTPAQKAIIARAVLRDEAMQKSQGIIAYLEEIGNQRQIFGALDEKGLIASGNLKGLAINDIRSYPKKYESKLTTPQKQWLARAQEIEEAKLDYLKQNDIPINELTFEEGGVYAGRRAYGKIASNGETIDVAFVGAAPKRVGAKLPVEKHRTFKTAKEAIDAGYRYIPDDEALALNVQGAYYRVADKKMSGWLLNQVPWRTTGAPDELVLAAESAKLHTQASSKLRTVLSRAVRGERVPDNTIQSIARVYPQQAKQLKDLIPRIQAGEETAKEVKALTSTAKELHKVDLAILRDAVNARARARERAMTPRIGEAMVMHPAFQGKIFTGAEAKETGRTLTNELAPQFSKTLGSVNKYNALVRYFKLAGDFSPMMIQLLFLSGENPRIYGDAFVRGFQALASPKEHAKYLALNKDVIDRHPNLIMSSKGTEFTEALTRGGLLRPHITLVPENENFVKTVTLFALRAVAKVSRTVLEPFQRFFEASLDDAGIEMAKSMEHLAKTPEDIAQLDQFINEFRGLTSSAKLGVSPNWSAGETATLLAPRYNRAIAALLFDAFKGMGVGGLRSKLARNALIKGIGVVTLVWVAIGIALGKSKEEIQESIINGKFTYNVGGVNIGPGTKVRSVAKLAVDSASNPDALLQLSMDNPALRFVRGNLSPVGGSAIDILTGRNYIGEPVRDSFGTFTKEMLVKQMLPIWVENVLYEGGTPSQRFIRGAGEFWGGRTFPETSWQQAQKLRDRYSLQYYGLKYENLNNAQKNTLKQRHPDLEVAEIIAEEEAAKKGTPVERFYYSEKERITQARNNALEKAAQSYLSGQISKYDYDKERGYIRPYYSGGREVLWSVRESFDEYSVKQMEKWLDENQKPEDKALNEYQEYRAELIEKADLPRDWDIIERETYQFLDKYSPTIQAYIIANQDAWLKDLPSAAKQVEMERAAGIEDESWWRNYRTAGRRRIGQPQPSVQQTPPVIIRGYANRRK